MLINYMTLITTPKLMDVYHMPSEQKSIWDTLFYALPFSVLLGNYYCSYFTIEKTERDKVTSLRLYRQ